MSDFSEEHYEDKIGERIECEGSYGVIHYVGPVITSQSASTKWLGIEWETKGRGKHDGSVTAVDGQTKRYYTCPENQGSFIKPSKAKFGRDLLTVIKNRFDLESLDGDLKEQHVIEASSVYKLKFVGWDKSIRQAHRLDNKTHVFVDQNNTAFIDLTTCDEMKQTLPCVEVLDLRRNSLSSWKTLHGLEVFTNLKELHLSHNPLNLLYFRSELKKNQSKEDLFKPFKDAFKQLQLLCLNDTCSPVERQNNYSTTWWIVYHLALYSCLPQLTELQICSNQLTHFNFTPNLDSEEKLFGPDSAHVAKLFPYLKILNIGDNPIEDWNTVVNTFGDLPALVKLQCSFANINRIFYVPNKFEQLEILWARNNKIESLETFDELNKFPKLDQLLIIENPLAKEYGDMIVRDLLIAKIAKLTVCNSSGVATKERNDAELFYLKWIVTQWSKMNNGLKEENKNEDSDKKIKEDENVQICAKKTNNTNEGKDNGDGEDEDDAIQQKFARYKELKLKWGVQKRTKTCAQNIDTVSVTIQSMDPRSITSQLIEKNLPLSLTIGQLKMLCKRLFQLSPKYQRLMLRNSGDMFPDDMPDDMKTLTYYGVKDKAHILMQTTDFTN